VAQWRLVMAFSGFEILSKGLVFPRQRDWNNPKFREFIREMEVSIKLSTSQILATLPSPRRGNQTQQRFFESTQLKAGGAMARLLNLNQHDIKLLGDWINGEAL